MSKEVDIFVSAETWVEKGVEYAPLGKAECIKCQSRVHLYCVMASKGENYQATVLVCVPCIRTKQAQQQ